MNFYQQKFNAYFSRFGSIYSLGHVQRRTKGSKYPKLLFWIIILMFVQTKYNFAFLKGFWEEIQVSDYRSSTLKIMYYNLPNIKFGRHSQVITDPRNNVTQLPPTLFRHFEWFFSAKKSVCQEKISKYGDRSLLFYPPPRWFYQYRILSSLRTWVSGLCRRRVIDPNC